MIAVLASRTGAIVLLITAALAVAGGIYALGRGAGGDAAARRQAEAAQQQATERARADVEADRDADPLGRLRRDWSR